MDYPEVLNCLNTKQENLLNISFDNINNFVNYYKDNLKEIRFIQVAGTNGKGSVANFISAILIGHSYKCGLFTSPHYSDVRERIAVNGNLIDKQDFAILFQEVQSLTKKLIQKEIIESELSYFETLFIISLMYFVKEKVDYAVLEVGLGGRLDATSTIIPLVHVITNISLEHTNILGDTLEKIALEKALILKEDSIIVTSQEKGSARDVIKKVAKDKKNKFIDVIDEKNIIIQDDKGVYFYKSDKNEYKIELKVVGKHQVLNCATAIRAVEELPFQINKDLTQKSISECFLLGRIEKIGENPAIYIDGSHNSESVSALSTFLKEHNFSDMTLIFGILKDKNYIDVIKQLEPFIGRVILCQVSSDRALESSFLYKYFTVKEKYIEDDYAKALKRALSFNKTILICGSIYLAGLMRDYILSNRSFNDKK